MKGSHITSIFTFLPSIHDYGEAALPDKLFYKLYSSLEKSKLNLFIE